MNRAKFVYNTGRIHREEYLDIYERIEIYLDCSGVFQCFKIDTIFREAQTHTELLDIYSCSPLFPTLAIFYFIFCNFLFCRY